MMLDLADEKRVREIVRDETQDIRDELRGLGVRFEHMEDMMQAMAEMLSTCMEIKFQVANHEERMAALEAAQALLMATVTDHSRKLV